MAAKKSQTIFRVASRDMAYSQLGNAMIRDKRLSRDARFALIFILTYPPTWKLNQSWVSRELDMGRDKTYRCINELIQFRYCVRVQHRDEGGKLGNIEYFFTDVAGSIKEEPLPENQDAATQDVVPPLPGLPDTAGTASGKNDNDKETLHFTSQSISTIGTKDKDAREHDGSIGTDSKLPFSSDVISQIAAIDVDVDQLVDRYLSRTKHKRVKDPSAYLLRMAHDEAAKRLGVTADHIKNSTARDPSRRVLAAVEATRAFSVPSADKIALARRRGRRFIPEVLAMLAKRSFPTQAACDQSFEMELVNARWRPPMSATVPDLFTVTDQIQRKDDAA